MDKLEKLLKRIAAGIERGNKLLEVVVHDLGVRALKEGPDDPYWKDIEESAFHVLEKYMSQETKRKG